MKICVILAGGESKRMGFDKRKLMVSEKNIIEYEADRLKKNNFRVYISGFLLPNRGNFFFIEDKIKGRGPLMGIYSAFQYLKSSFVAISCDSPFFNIKLLNLFMSYDSYDVVLARIAGKRQYFPAFYSINCLEEIDTLLKNKIFSIKELCERVKILEIKEERIKKIDKELLSFANLNTKEDIEEMNRKLQMSDLNYEIRIK